jgi:tetratricopeptide (TPR) repeat protein
MPARLSWSLSLVVLPVALVAPTCDASTTIESPCRPGSGSVSDASASQASGNQRIASKAQKLANPLNDLLDEAQRDIDNKDFEAALIPLKKFIAEQPDVAYGHFQLAYVFTALQRSDDAHAEYDRVIALDPKMPEAYLNLGLLLLDKREYAAAVAPLRKAVDLLPAQSRPRFLLAIAQERAGDAVGAAQSFQGVLGLEPNNLDALSYLADLSLQSGNLTDAAIKFTHVLDLQPNSLSAWKGLAASLDAQNKPEAIAAYQKYLALQPGDTAVRARYIHLLIAEQKYDQALAELDRADTGKPASLESLRQRADIQIAQKKPDDAIVSLQRAIALSPKDPQLRAGLGRIYLQKRDFPAAERELKTAIQMDPSNVVYWKDLSSTYYLAGDCPNTIAALDVIAKAEPPGAASWFLRGLCYDKLHLVHPALDAYQKFLDMDQGKNPDQVWQAQQRSKVLKDMLDHKR